MFDLSTQVGFRTPSAVWSAGGCVAFTQELAEDHLKADSQSFFRHAVNFSIVTPLMLNDLLQSAGPSNVPNNECRLVVTAGFLSLALAEKAIHKLTNNIDVSYGSTELCTPAMVSHLENMESLYWLTPANERVIQIVDEVGDQCLIDQEGELRILSEDTDCKSYLDDEQASAKVFRDGFFYPGDMAIRRADGRIRILGRVSDVINIQGKKVAVGRIEEPICRFLQADEVCLFTHLNDAGQDELIVAMQSDRKPPTEKLHHIEREFASFESIRFAVFREFPRTDTGTRKVRRADLKALILAKGTSREIPD
jgi:acyl-coenzyme A synthetase/AMP-(fatty) acid ligase